jgi:type III secretory pathway component EscS
MLTLLQNKKLNFLISLFAVSAVLFSALPFSAATAATTKSELIKNITQDLEINLNAAKKVRK